MSGSRISEFLADEEAALQALLVRLPRDDDGAQFDRFRRRALQRVAIEERVLIPELAAAIAHVPARRLIHQAHLELVTVCVPAPHAEWLEELPRRLSWLATLKTDVGYYAALDLHLSTAALERGRSLPSLKLPPLARDRHQVAPRLAQLRRETGLVSL